ncbi:MAG: hypothetical protein HN826_05480 [Methylococcales bacterium]|nr:hypothetical protein [Methylococcales bacterium]
MDNDDINLFQEDYILKRLVYVNSANHGYSEIMLDNHLAMFGRNNAGKTASLAGTKLLLFPEVNFYKCEKKFKFEGKTGLYSMVESYEFYFPDPKSFIILEVQNPENTFCMILYKMNNYGYGRCFIPLPYQEVRHLFWNTESNHFNDDLGLQMVSQFVKQSNGIQITDPAEICYLMFSSFRDGKFKKRFCVLPLKDGRPDSIKAFKNIYQLAFETGKKEARALPEAIATLLEMGRGRDEERLDADLNKLPEQYEALRKKQQWIQSLVNAKPRFDRVKSNFDAIKEAFTAYSSEFNSVESALVRAKEDYVFRAKEAQEKFNQVNGVKQELNNKINKLDRQLLTNKGAISTLDKRYRKDVFKSESTKKLIGTYGSNTPREIIEILNEELDKERSNLKQYQEEDGIKNKLEKNIRDKNKCSEQFKKFNELIENSESTILYQLDSPDSVNALISLNKNLANIATPINEQQKKIILAFTELFGQDIDRNLTFLDKTVIDTPYKVFDSKQQIVNWAKEKLTLENKIDDLDKEIEYQHKAIKEDNVEELIKSTKGEIDKIIRELESISGLPELERSISQSKTEIEHKELQQKTDTMTLDELQANFNQIKGDWNIANHEISRLQEQQQSFDKIDNRLKVAKSLTKPIDCQYESLDLMELNHNKAEAVADLAGQFAQKFSYFNGQLQKLIDELPSSDVDPHKERACLNECERIVQSYLSAFSTLEYDRNQYLNEIRSHNQLVSSQLNELKETGAHLTNSIHDINNELNDKNISNLSEIKLHLVINKRFESLLATLEKHDIQDDTLLEAQFYSSLTNFVEDFFNKKSRRLKIHDIISSIDYHYTLEETGEVVTKAQSGGTTATISAFVLSILLKRIIPHYISLSFPIIVDEIGTLDSYNTDAAIKQIADHGFSIFCATPQFSPSVSMKVGRWIMIDHCMVEKPLVNKCHINILPDHIQKFGEVKREA